MSGRYVLDGKKAVPCEDLMEWAIWLEGADKKVALTRSIGDVEISTVFIGLDHSFGKGPPLIFETMVFGGPLDGEQDRYSTWEEAEAGHEKMVERTKAES